MLPYAAGSMTCGPDREFLEQPVGEMSWAAAMNRARLVLLAQCPLCPDSDQMLPAQRNDAMCQQPEVPLGSQPLPQTRPWVSHTDPLTSFDMVLRWAANSQSFRKPCFAK